MITGVPNTTKDRSTHELNRGSRKIRVAVSTQIRTKKRYGNNNDAIYSAVYQHDTITRILLHLSFEYNMLTIKPLKVTDKIPNLSFERKMALLHSCDEYRKKSTILQAVEQEIFNKFYNALDGEMLSLDDIINRLREKGLQEQVIENFISRVSYYL